MSIPSNRLPWHVELGGHQPGRTDVAQAIHNFSMLVSQIRWNGAIKSLRDHSYITQAHFYDFWTPSPIPLCKHDFSTESKQKLAFSDPPPTLCVQIDFMRTFEANNKCNNINHV